MRVANTGTGLKKPVPIEFDVIRATDFVRFDADQHLNFQETRRVLQELAVACRKRGLDRAMIDLRDLPVPEKPRFTNTELASLVDGLRTAGFTQRQRLAVLYRQDVHGTIRSFTIIGRQRGLQVEAFFNQDKAMHWLWKEIENPQDKHGIEVPIVRHRRKARAARLAAKSERTTAPRRARR